MEVSKMVTAAELRRRLESLERSPRAQETKIFFVEEGEDPAITQAQWAAVKAWQRVHPWGQAHVIVCEEVTAHYPTDAFH